MKSQLNSRLPGMPKFITVSAFLCALLYSGLAYVAEEDDYLKALETESQKIEGSKELDNDAEATEGAEAEPVDTQRSEFEEYLKSKHKGTYAFYRKLPGRSREEIFRAFMDGASMKDIRHMVIERKMNQ